MGAWIEILAAILIVKFVRSLLSWERGLKYLLFYKQPSTAFVAPLVGAWIEIDYLHRPIVVIRSLLSWERGLKYLSMNADDDGFVSLLSWERGLKF